MAKKHTIDIDIKNNADETAKDFDTLNKSMDNTTKSAKNLDSSFEEVYGDLQPLTTRMGEAEDRLYELSLAGDTASQEFQELLTKVGQYRKVQIDTDLAVDAAATTMGQKLGGALTGTTAGFSLATGAMGLMGAESEKVEKLLLKVQSAMAIQQGIQGIRESIPHFKQLGMVAKTAFAGMTKAGQAFAVTGIGLVITAIAALAYALNELDEQEKRADEARDKRHEAELKRYEEEIASRQKGITAQNEALDEAAKERQHQVKLLQAQGKGIVEAEYEVAIKAMDDIKTKGTNAAAEHKRLGDETKKMYEDLAKGYEGILTKEEEATYKSEKKLLDQKRKANTKQRGVLAEQIKTLITMRTDGFNNLEILEAQNLTNRRENWKKYRDARLKFARQIQDLENQIMEDGEAKDVEISNTRFERLIEDVKKNADIKGKEKIRLEQLYLFQQQEAEDKIRNKYRQDQLDKEIKDLEEAAKELAEIRQKLLDKEKADKEVLAQVTTDYFDRESQERLGAYAVEVAQTNAKYDALVKLAKLHGENTFHIEKERQAALDLLDEENDEKKLERKHELEALILQGAKDTFTTIGNLAQLFAGESEESQRKAFKVQKVANIANATIDTYASAVAAFRSLSGVPVVGVPLGIAAAAAAVTAGMLNIKSIAQQQFEGGASGGSAAVPSGIGEAQAPSFNVVGDSGVNQLAQIQQQPTQAFVVSGEVTTSQALDRNRVQNATL